ncbi:MAG: sarcosine oxidase subunit gamma [Geodermatophilaceae bacterium]|nr:sarcosine oxidase subunit gamma [Geodermatophilaceae bacterium]
MTADPGLLAVRRGPLTGALAAGSAQTVAVRDVPGRTLVELRVATNQDGSGAVESALGFDLPAAGHTSRDGQQLAVWLGPGWWLLDAPAATGPRTLEAPLVHRLRDSGGELSAVEVSAGFAVLELSGPRAPAVLAHGCSIDLHPRVFGRGRSARTMLAKAQVVFALTDDAPTYRIWVRSSFARYLVAWLLDAATEYLCEDPTRSSG